MTVRPRRGLWTAKRQCPSRGIWCLHSSSLYAGARHTNMSLGSAFVASSGVGSGSSNAVRYRRVSLDEPQEADPMVETLKKNRAETFERINMKIQALAWVVIAAVVVYYTNFFHVLFSDPKVDRLYFNIATICFGINCCIAFYLTVWLPYVKRIEIDWNIYCPRMIPTATGVGVLCMFTSIRSLWPVWGFLTPLIILIVFMGSVFSLHFLPFPC